MSEKTLRQVISKFLEELTIDVMEERVVQYIIRELKNGRKIAEILKDPYVTNRIPEEGLADLLANKELIDIFESEIDKVFKKDLNLFGQSTP